MKTTNQFHKTVDAWARLNWNGSRSESSASNIHRFREFIQVSFQSRSHHKSKAPKLVHRLSVRAWVREMFAIIFRLCQCNENTRNLPIKKIVSHLLHLQQSGLFCFIDEYIQQNVKWWCRSCRHSIWYHVPSLEIFLKPSYVLFFWRKKNFDRY